MKLKNPIFWFVFFMMFSLKWLYGLEIYSNYFIHGQNRFNTFLKWYEINNNQILYEYYLPTRIENISQNNFTNNLFIWHDLKDLNLSWKTEPSIIFTNRSQGIREIIMGTVAINMSPQLIIQNDFEFDSDGYNDPHFRVNHITESVGKWTGYLQHSSITYIYNNGYFLIGRGNLFSSVYNHSLLINPAFPPAELVWWHHARNRLVYDWSIIILDPVDEKNRFLSLHRYAYQTKTWRIGLSEMALVSYHIPGVEQLRYSLPASVFFETEINGGENSNLMWAMDFLIKMKGTTLNGEVLVDDISIDKGSPPKIGVKFGLGGTMDNFEYYLEYVHINRWTGGYFYPELRYVENDVLIGHPLGPDAHSMSISFYKELYDRFISTFTFQWSEHGGGDINEWPEGIGPGSNFGWFSEPFPSRPIETTFETTAEIGYYYKNINFNIEIKLSTNEKTMVNTSVYIAI